MDRAEMRFLTPELDKQLTELVDQYVAGTVEYTPEEIFKLLIKLLPLERGKRATINRRVEGLAHVIDLLWKKVEKIGNLKRPDIIRRAKIRPMTYYHHLTGSRIPADFADNRSQLFNDPSTALAKFQDDIKGLIRLLKKLIAEEKTEA
ncbi:MAG: hypothetical protein P9X24_03365 [Candidatus Hatepunaea meridiana]|nr:hypothetical protein [Candidatus Hatepunaea meridiana]